MMKKFLVILCCLLFFTVIGAEIKEGTPSYSVKTFFDSMAKADIAKAKTVIESREVVGMLEFIEAAIKETPELKSDTVKEFAHYAAAKFISEKISGNTAEVVVSIKEKGKEKKEIYKLKKLGGIWKLVESSDYDK